MTGVSDTGCAGRGRVWAKECAVGILTDADIEAEDARTIQMGGAVEVAVILGHDGSERKALIWSERAVGVIEEEGIAPRHLGSTRLARRDEKLDVSKCVGDEFE